MGKGSKQKFFQGKYTEGQQAHEKTFNITNYQRNADQNHNKYSPSSHSYAFLCPQKHLLNKSLICN